MRRIRGELRLRFARDETDGLLLLVEVFFEDEVFEIVLFVAVLLWTGAVFAVGGVDAWPAACV
jgi:hypothetical protein